MANSGFMALGNYVQIYLGISSGRRQESVVILTRHIKEHREDYPLVDVQKKSTFMPITPTIGEDMHNANIERARKVLEAANMYQPLSRADRDQYISSTDYLKPFMSGVELVKTRRMIEGAVERGQINPKATKKVGRTLYFTKTDTDEIDAYLKRRKITLKLKSSKDGVRTETPEKTVIGFFGEQIVQESRIVRDLSYHDASTISPDTREGLVKRLRDEVQESLRAKREKTYTHQEMTQVFSIPHTSIAKNAQLLGKTTFTSRGTEFNGIKVLELAELILEQERQKSSIPPTH